MARDPAFEIVLTGETEPGETLLVGMAGLGVAGLTATDYLVTNIENNQIGHVRTRNLPDITPFTEGRPRHPIRLYSAPDSNVTVLISEVFLPPPVADPLTDAVLDWVETHGIGEITVLYGAPFPHSEEEHRVFHVATDEYRTAHFPTEEPEIGPLPGGFFDGVVAELVVRSLDGEAPPTGVLVTPTHLPGPDFEAALRLLDALEPVYGIEVTEVELQRRAEEMRQYYEDLVGRMQAMQEAGREEEYSSDRMFM
jgi:uncharacterized protein